LRRLARATAVVGRVEAGPLVVDRNRVEHAHERRSVADLALRRARLVHAVEDLEQMPVRAFVLVDRHRTRKATSGKPRPPWRGPPSPPRAPSSPPPGGPRPHASPSPPPRLQPPRSTP